MYIENYPNESAEIISKKLGTSLVVQMESLKHLNLTYDPSGNYTTDVEYFMAIQKKLGYLTYIPQNESLYDF